jgi:hypothetical protein
MIGFVDSGILGRIGIRFSSLIYGFNIILTIHIRIKRIRGFSGLDFGGPI